MRTWLSSQLPTGCRRVIVLGASARAAAGSVLRAGFEPWCIDLFADRDLRAIAPVARCPRDRYPQAMIDLLDDAPAGPLLLTGAMEAHPQTVRAIASRRRLLGWTPERMQTVRAVNHAPDHGEDPLTLALSRGERGPSPRMLVKRRYGAGGRGVRFHQPGEALGPNEYLQPFIPGMPISAVFLGDRCLGATRQIIGEARLGASGFTYAGSLGPIDVPDALRGFGQTIARRFNVTGIFGVDAIMDDGGRVHPVEINPRYPASVEVIERGVSKAYIFATARLAKARGSPSPNMVVGDLYDHFAPDEIADVPEPGAVVRAGEPICTVFGRDLDQLHALADRVYTRCLHESRHHARR